MPIAARPYSTPPSRRQARQSRACAYAAPEAWALDSGEPGWEPPWSLRLLAEQAADAQLHQRHGEDHRHQHPTDRRRVADIALLEAGLVEVHDDGDGGG